MSTSKAKKRKLDFMEARDGWTKPKRIKKASLVDENEFVSGLFDNDAQLYAKRCLEQLEQELKCNGCTDVTDVDVVLLFLLPVLEHIREMTNQAINLHNMTVDSLEQYEMVQFMAILLLSHYSRYSFKVEKLRRKLNATTTIGDFTKNICEKLLGWAEAKMPADKIIRPTAVIHAANAVHDQPENVLDWVFAGKKVSEMREQARKESRNKKKVFNDDNDGFKAMRLDRRLGHVPVRTHGNFQKVCAMCNVSRKWTECFICGVTLCCNGDKAESSCFMDFHVNQQLN
jgi:hypothetical protein